MFVEFPFISRLIEERWKFFDGKITRADFFKCYFAISRKTLWRLRGLHNIFLRITNWCEKLDLDIVFLGTGNKWVVSKQYLPIAILITLNVWFPLKGHLDLLNATPTIRSNTLKQLVGCYWRIVWVCLTIL